MKLRVLINCVVLLWLSPLFVGAEKNFSVKEIDPVGGKVYVYATFVKTR